MDSFFECYYEYNFDIMFFFVLNWLIVPRKVIRCTYPEGTLPYQQIC